MGKCGYKEEWKTFGNVFDEFTIQKLKKLCTQRHFDGIESPISIGKEANIFTAIKDDHKIILKIYRLETCDFNQMYSYIRSDPRYQNLKKNRRQIIFSWAQREFRNLFKAREADVAVPTPISYSNNILLLEYIGDENPAPKLKDLSPKNPRKFFNLLLENMKKIHAAGLVHGDLSSFNILNHNEKPVIIDFSQGTMLSCQNADGYIKRDIKNIVNYFNKQGLKLNEDDIYKKITATPKTK